MHIERLMHAQVVDGRFDAETRPFAASAMWEAAAQDDNCDPAIPVSAKFGKHHRAANIVIHAILIAVEEHNGVARRRLDFVGYEALLTALFESIDAVREGF